MLIECCNRIILRNKIKLYFHLFCPVIKLKNKYTKIKFLFNLICFIFYCVRRNPYIITTETLRFLYKISQDGKVQVRGSICFTNSGRENLHDHFIYHFRENIAHQTSLFLKLCYKNSKLLSSSTFLLDREHHVLMMRSSSKFLILKHPSLFSSH